MTETGQAWTSDPGSPVPEDSPYTLLGILSGQDAVYVFVEGPVEVNPWPAPPPAWVPWDLRLTTSAGTPVAFRGGGKHSNDKSTLYYAEFERRTAATGPLTVQLDLGDTVAFAGRAVAVVKGTTPAYGRIWLASESSRPAASTYRLVGGVEGRESLYLWAEGPGWSQEPGGQPAEPALNLAVIHAGETLPTRGAGSGINRRRSLVNCEIIKPAADVVRLDAVLTVKGAHELTAAVLASHRVGNID